LAKVTLVVERETVEAAPVPVKPTVCGLPLALSVTVSVPVRVPVAEGVKVTLIVQMARVARVEVLGGQLLVCEKSPDMAMLEMVTGTDPVLVTTTG